MLRTGRDAHLAAGICAHQLGIHIPVSRCDASVHQIPDLQAVGQTSAKNAAL